MRSNRGFRFVDVTWALLGQVADRGAMFIASVLLARSLPAGEFSQFGFFLMTVSAISAFSTLGVGVSSSRMFARWNTGDERAVSGIVVLWLACLLVGIFSGVMSAGFKEVWHPNPSQLSGPLHAAAVLTITLGIVPQGGMLGCGKFKAASLVAVLSGITIFAGCWIAATRQSVVLAQTWLVCGYAVSTMLATGIVLRKFPVLVRRFSAVFRFRQSWVTIYSVGPLALVSILAVSANWIAGRMLLNVPGVGEIEFSALVLGLQWFGIVQLIPAMITKAAFPAMASAEAEQTSNRHEVVMESVRWTLGSGVLVALLICAASSLLIRMYGSGEFSTLQLIAFAIAAVPAGCANSIGNALVAAGASKAWLLVTACWFLVFLVFATVLRQLGAFGIAVSLGISGLVMTSCAMIAAHSVGLLKKK